MLERAACLDERTGPYSEHWRHMDQCLNVLPRLQRCECFLLFSLRYMLLCKKGRFIEFTYGTRTLLENIMLLVEFRLLDGWIDTPHKHVFIVFHLKENKNFTHTHTHKHTHTRVLMSLLMRIVSLCVCVCVCVCAGIYKKLFCFIIM